MACRAELLQHTAPSDTLLALCSSAAYGERQDDSQGPPAAAELACLEAAWGISAGVQLNTVSNNRGMHFLMRFCKALTHRASCRHNVRPLVCGCMALLQPTLELTVRSAANLSCLPGLQRALR